MSIKIESGLFSLDFTDHYAILGAPINADAASIRKQYLKLARRLHPDSFAAESEGDRQRAQEYLSKWVNPAYECLKDEKNFKDYQVTLKLMAQKALRQQETIVLTSDTARILAATRGELENPYREAIQQLSRQQYEQLDQVPALTAALSELNLIYLMRKGFKPPPPPTGSGGDDKTEGSGQSGAAVKPPPAPVPPSLLDRYLNRAQQLTLQGNPNEALRELREAVRTYPDNPRAQGELGLHYYTSLKQPTMAKIHLRKALELKSPDPRVLQALKRIDPTAVPTTDTSNGNSPDAKTGKATKDNKSSGGLFNMFGKKK